MDLKKGMNIRHHHVSFALIIIILLIITLLIMIKPALTGYMLNKELEELGTSAGEFLRKIDLFNSEIIVLKTNIENCQNLNNDYLQQITDEKENLFLCQEEKRKIQSEFEQLENEYEFNLTRIMQEQEEKKSQAELELNQLKIEFDEAEKRFDRIIQNAANNICCKNRIDNPDIDSYTISEGRIICNSGKNDKIIC